MQNNKSVHSGLQFFFFFGGGEIIVCNLGTVILILLLLAQCSMIISYSAFSHALTKGIKSNISKLGPK